MNILGVNFYQHNASVALVQNGKLVYAIEEERLSRIKDDGQIPVRSVKYCLSQAKLSLDDIDLITISIDFKRLLKKKYLEYTLKQYPLANDLFIQNIDNFKRLYNAEDEFREKLNYKGKIKYVKHYLGHIASSYFLSGYKNSALVSVDGLGEFESTVIGKFENGKLEILKKINFPHSLGLLYAAITRYLGFNSGSEGTVMALASFGDEKSIIPGTNKNYLEVFDKMLILKQDTFELNLKYFNFPYTKEGWVSEKFTSIFGAHKNYEDIITDHHRNIAAALQKVFEKGYIHIMKIAQNLSKFENLSLAGGCALNCVANGKIKKYTNFKDIYTASST